MANSEGYGVEISLRTKRISALNMIFRIDGAFNLKRYSYNDYRHYGSTHTISSAQSINADWEVDESIDVIPYYSPYRNWRQKMVVNYSLDYITASLGIWVRFKAQQVILDKNLNNENPTYSARGVFTRGEHYKIDAQTSADLGLDRRFDQLDLTVDNSRLKPKWLFSLTASKSLYKGAEISFFVENIFNDLAYYLDRKGYYRARSPQIFWGIGFSTIIDDLF